VRTPWDRTDHTGKPAAAAVMSMMRGRLFEKGRRALFHRARRVRAGIPRADSGRSRRSRVLGVRHFADRPLRNPHVPAVHMNTRFVVTTKAWFGGGADLTPVLDRRRTQEDPTRSPSTRR
jgi:coproporphyrinogen III oxidase